ncbi:zinc ABC transporter substrate-binding protein [Microbulbifer flavimaris]|uniref:High-affinity zinc uptake system protein ZnuA n=1 Tax=Microbulbifer flavimaris TaxID=1781068 RepID=A0ABX4HYU1_9GAMM|nr:MULTISPECIES: metal ABC transporter substrate-binding protein [Microbulbifer]PCO05231.1 zinc ABC transporter substrate-binding protein [Microbulbifer flavimaris]
MIPIKHLSALFSILAVLAVSACSTREPPGDGPLVVSVRPLALIAAEIAGPEQEIRELIQSGDPHHYAPSVSDRAALDRAALVVWLGPKLETMLAKQLSQVPAEHQLALLEQGGFEMDGAAADDPHLWLRPRNAAIIGAQVAARLSQLRPQQADEYRRRARDFSREMANLQKVLDRALWAYRDVPIVVTHDAYGHFFGNAGVVTRPLGGTGGENRHGARTLLELGDIEDGCLFGEAPANDRDRQLAENLGLRYVALDPLGRALPPEAGYADLVEALLADARQCLSLVPDQAGG